MRLFYKELSRVYLWCIGLLFLIGCSDDEPVRISVEPRLTSSELIFTRPAGEIRGLLSAFPSNIPIEKIQHNVEFWKVEYETQYGDQAVTASGVVFIPEGDLRPAFLSYQHGTIAENRSVPSVAPINDVQNLLLAGLAGTGFITTAPDYIGFGSSLDIAHPYYVEQPTRDAVLDLLRAAAELASANELRVSNHLYLMGYSQGGYATMAAHKGIEEEGIEFFELQASFPSSGGYDIIGVRDYFVEQEVYHQPFYLAFVGNAYRTYYGFDESFLTSFFQEPYASAIPGYFDGSLSGGQINDLLNDTLSVILQPDFISTPDAPQYDEINNKFEENSLIDWIPQTTMYLYHGDADITVPYQNSVDSYDRLISNGASSSIVTFTTLPGATHSAGFLPYLEDILPKLLESEGL